MEICEVTGNVHRSPRELKAELIRLDTLIAAMRQIEIQYRDLAASNSGVVLPTQIGDGWNAAHDAIAALKRERADVEANPRPIPGHEAGTYRLAVQNID